MRTNTSVPQWNNAQNNLSFQVVNVIWMFWKNIYRVALKIHKTEKKTFMLFVWKKICKFKIYMAGPVKQTIFSS